MNLIGRFIASARSALAGMFRGSRHAVADGSMTLHTGYESARRDGPNAAIWGGADTYSADASHSRDVRHTLVSRSRHNAENDGYYSGSLQTHATAIVGTGPILRMQTGNAAFNSAVEADWAAWFAAVQGRRKVHCMALAWKKDGEVYGLIQDNPAIQHAVKLDFQPIEAEQCQTPNLPFGIVGRIDGMHFDRFGNVAAYDVLPVHPGDGNQFVSQVPDTIPARDVLHLFSMQRPGQHRGVPACSSTLNVSKNSNRFREAVVVHAEHAAKQTSVLYTDLPPNTDEAPATVKAMTSVPVAHGMMTAVPRGWKQDSYKSDQPKTGYGEFTKQQVAESSRPLSMPYAVAAADASDANFSSLKTCHIWWGAQIAVDRADIEELLMERMFRLWWLERQRQRGVPISVTLELGAPAHKFAWPVQPSADRNADAKATDTQLRNGTVTWSRAMSDQGHDPEDELIQLATDYGVTVDEMRKVLLHTFFPAAAQALAPAKPAPALVSSPADNEDTELEVVADDETTLA